MAKVWSIYAQDVSYQVAPSKNGTKCPWGKMSLRRKTKYPLDKMSPNHLEQAGRVFPKNFLRTANAFPWSHATPICFDIFFGNHTNLSHANSRMIREGMFCERKHLVQKRKGEEMGVKFWEGKDGCYWRRKVIEWEKGEIFDLMKKKREKIWTIFVSKKFEQFC